MFMLCFVKIIKFSIATPKTNLNIHTYIQKTLVLEHLYVTYLLPVNFSCAYILGIIDLCNRKFQKNSQNLIQIFKRSSQCSSISLILLALSSSTTSVKWLILFQDGFVIIARWLSKSSVVLFFFMSKGKKLLLFSVIIQKAWSLF